MQKLNQETAPKALRPERIIQFGEGNFLRAFAEWIVWRMNQVTNFNGSIVVVQPIPEGKADQLNEQDNLYHLRQQGNDHGKAIDSITLIDVISRTINPYTDHATYLDLAEQEDLRYVISNTTEVGITYDPSCRLSDTPPSTYPAKLTQLLFLRYLTFGGARDKGLIIFPCELINQNGLQLRYTIYHYIKQWKLGDDFLHWFMQSCHVCPTLVDRIVPGYPRRDLDIIQEVTGYDDKLLVHSEGFYLWLIEGSPEIEAEFPVTQAGLNVIFVEDLAPYHARKVTLLNAPHSLLAPVGLLSGMQTVREASGHEVVGAYLRHVMVDELAATINLPHEDKQNFIVSVLDRFHNPAIEHHLSSIMLNAFAKFRERNLPAIKTYQQAKGCLPQGLVLGMAALVTYYRGGNPTDDTPQVTTLMHTIWQSNDMDEIAYQVLSSEQLWNEDLNQIPGLTESLTTYLSAIEDRGMSQTLIDFLA